MTNEYIFLFQLFDIIYSTMNNQGRILIEFLMESRMKNEANFDLFLTSVSEFQKETQDIYFTLR